jgi:SAM-dependent methyltransferase
VVDDKFKHDLSWEEKAKKNPLYGVMSANETFAEKDADPAKWTKADLEIFYEKGRLLFDTFIRPVLLRADIKPKGAFVVEYGSGLGTILKAVKAAGYDCAGIDISATMLGFSRQVVPEVTKLYCLDDKGRSEMATACADMVFTRAVMQHIKDLSNVRTAISEMARILKPGGYLKMHFRSLSTLPFTGAPITQRNRVLNGENRSAIIHFATRPWLPVTLPVLGVVKHTNWVGVPLSIQNVKRFFKENGLELLGLEKDIGGKDRFYWALARKVKA